MTYPPLILERGSGALRTLPKHRNRGLEMVYLERGVLQWEVDGHRETLSPGMVFFTLPWQWHGSALPYEPGHRWHFVVLRVDGTRHDKAGRMRLPGELNLSEPENRDLVATLCNARRHSYSASPTLTAAIRALAEGYDETSALSRRKAIAWATLAVVSLTEAIRQEATPTDEDDGRGKVTRVVNALRSDPSRPWQLEEVCRLADLRKSRFCELFARHTGDTFARHLQRCRVEWAQNQLRNTSHSITRIALDSGFSSSQYFAKVFRDFTGMTPGDYRSSSSSARLSRR